LQVWNTGRVRPVLRLTSASTFAHGGETMARRHPYRPRRTRHRRGLPVVPIVAGLSVLAVGAWWLAPDAQPLDNVPLLGAQPLGNQKPALAGMPGGTPDVAKRGPASDRPGAAPSPRTNVPAKRAHATPAKPATDRGTDQDRLAALVRAGDQALAQHDVITARARYSEAMLLDVGEPDRTRLRAALTRIGTDTILSPRTWSDDVHVARYTIKPGDTLGKIAKANRVSAGLLASINNIENVNLIRAGQVIKVIHGPFRAVVHKREYVLDVYLGDTFVTHFKVGLGADDGTPAGLWHVGTKLRNPTYYPPRGGQMIAADDPTNPLGERWIALIGADGDALGAERYGIHGTIDPESIGQSVSLGCIRMYNKDVVLLYTYLVETYSTVEVVE